MSVDGVMNVAGFYRRRAGLIDVEEVDFVYDDAPLTALMLVGENVPSFIWWFAEIPRNAITDVVAYRMRVFSLDDKHDKMISRGTVARIEQLLCEYLQT